MKKYILLLGCVLLISGCASKPKKVTDYNTDTQAKESAMTTDNEQTDIDEMLKNASPFEFKYQTDDGIDIKVDAEVTASFDVSASVTEVERLVYTAKEKERIVKSLFDDGNVHIYDIKSKETTDNESEDYSQDAFWGSRAGVDFVIEFLDVNHKAASESEAVKLENHAYVIYPVNQTDVLPEKVSEYEEAEAVLESNGVQLIDDDTDDREVENKCKYTCEQAKKIAEKLLDNLNLSGYKMTSYENIQWMAGKAGANNMIQSDYYELNGYVFNFDLPLDGNELYPCDRGVGIDGKIIATNISDRLVEVCDGPTLCIAVNDNGVMYVQASMLYEIQKNSENISILPLSTIETALENELKTYNRDILQKFGFKDDDKTNIYYDSLMLQYYKNEKKNSETIYYLPVWRLTGNLNDINVNAIDGTVFVNGE